jgi:uncharacterized NAD(P)/FAD-binding protein YdhS
MPEPDAPDRIAIVGGGASGVLAVLALHKAMPTREIVLFEPATPGQGLAYGTTTPAHLLNVRAAGMSADAATPGDFEAWLNARPDLHAAERHATDSGLFVSRRLYAAYLQDRLAGAMAAAKVRIVQAAVTRIERINDCWHLTAAGATHSARDVVLALGNIGAAGPNQGRRIGNAFAQNALAGIGADDTVLILGTSLTMVDIVLGLADQGHRGPLVAISRRGLLPRAHQPTAPRPPALQPGTFTAAQALHRLRQDISAAGPAWRDAIDALRPTTQALWTSLSLDSRQRLLRHARPWWDVHRHRLPPPAADRIASLRASGRLRVAAAHVIDTKRHETGVDLTIRPRGKQTTLALRGDWLIDATGVPAQATARHPLLAMLIGAGHARPDALGLALDASAALGLIGANGHVTPGLWAIGPLLRGVFWECTAVPDIRGQAAALAREIAAQAGLRPTGASSGA